MSAQGVPFRHAISGCPWCTPFRGSLITSRYTHRATQRTPQALDTSLPTIADVFNKQGYRTAWFGKWHLVGSNKMEYVPRDARGRFGTWIGYDNNNAQYDCWVHGHDEKGRNDEEPLTEKLERYETDALTDQMLDYIKAQKAGNPFFAVLSVQPPHDPYVAPPEYLEKYTPEDVELRPNVPNLPS